MVFVPEGSTIVARQSICLASYGPKWPREHSPGFHPLQPCSSSFSLSILLIGWQMRSPPMLRLAVHPALRSPNQLRSKSRTRTSTIEEGELLNPTAPLLRTKNIPSEWRVVLSEKMILLLHIPEPPLASTRFPVGFQTNADRRKPSSRPALVHPLFHPRIGVSFCRKQLVHRSR
jgi:hypothetical protein